MIFIAIIKVYQFENNAEVRIDSGENISADEKARSIKNAIDAIEKIRAEIEEKNGNEGKT